MSYRSLGSDEVTLRNYRPVGRRKGNRSFRDPAAGVSLTFLNPASSVVLDRGCRLQTRRNLIFLRYFINRRFKSEVQQCSIDDMAE